MPGKFANPLLFPCCTSGCCYTCCCPCFAYGEAISTAKESGMHGCFLLIPVLNCMEICCVLPDARSKVRRASRGSFRPPSVGGARRRRERRRLTRGPFAPLTLPFHADA